MLRRNSPDTTGRITLGAILSVLALVLIFLDGAGFLRPFEQLSSTILNPLERASFQLGTNLSRLSDFLQDNQALRTENEQLRQELVAARDAQGKVAELANRVDQLERQLEFRRNPESRNMTVLNADVVNRDSSGTSAGIYINKGAEDGLTKGLPVVDTSGYLVGRIATVKSKESFVLLISDINVGVNIYTQRYDPAGKRISIQPVDGTAVGLFQNGTQDKIKIGRIQPAAEVQPEDWVFTNGIGNTYPPNLLIGKISRVLSQPGQPEKEAIVRPIADLEHLQQVLIITTWGQK